MKRFSLDIAFTLVLAVAMTVALEVTIVRTPNEYSYKDWYMTERADGIKTLLLGSSLFANSINPYYLGDSVFDGAIAARTISIDNKILNKYVPGMPNLTTIIIPVHRGNFEDSIPPMAFQQPYVTYMGLRFGHGMQYRADVLLESFHWRNLKPAHVVSSYKEGQKMQQLVPDSVGYSPLFRVWDGHTISNEVISLEKCNTYKDAFAQCVASIADRCDAQGIRLIFVQPPVTNTVLNITDQEVFFSLDSIMYSICKTHTCEYHSYYRDESFRSDSLYGDDSHLNHTGATLFAKRVKEDFKL